MRTDMRTNMKIIATATISLATTISIAGVAPFTETFETGTNGWLAGSFTAPGFTPAGALDGSAYISSSADLNSAGPFGLIVLRGQSEFNASGNAFSGNYLTSGINRISFDLRHNAGIDLGVALRIAGPTNFPGLAVELPQLVASDQWVSLSFDLDFSNPLLTLEGAPTQDFFDMVMESVGNLQVSIDRPDGLTTPFVVDFDLDNVSITPAPASLALLSVGGLLATRRRR